MEPVDPLAALPSNANPEPIPPPPPPMNVKYAGAMLIANALLLIAEFAIGQVMKSGDDVVGNRPPILPCLIDLAIGGSLASGNLKYRSLALVRIVLGAFVFGAISFSNGDPVTAVLQVVLSGSLLAMLAGNPGSARRGLAWTGFGLVAALELIGLFSTVTDKNPLASFVAGVNKDSSPLAGKVVRGVAVPYQLRVEGDGWSLRSDEAAKKDNPLADRWLTIPSEEVHVMVLTENIEAPLPIDAIAKAVEQNASQTGPQYKLIGVEKLTGHDDARLIHFTTTLGGMALEEIVGVFTDGAHIVQVTGFSAASKFPSRADELNKIIASFSWGPRP